MQHEVGTVAGATKVSNFVDADLVTVVHVGGTLVDVSTGTIVGVQSETESATAVETSLGVGTPLLAAGTEGSAALVDVHAMESRL